MTSNDMGDIPISVSDVVRHFAAYVNRVHDHGTSFVLLKRGVPFARLIPIRERVCRGAELAAALKKIKLSAREARAWSRDLQHARKKLKAPVDRWRLS